MKKKLIVIASVAAGVTAMSLLPVKTDHAKTFHTDRERQYFEDHVMTPIGPGDWFLTSESCRGCHGYDTLQQSNINENGEDVNLFDRWQSSMMALSAKDPLWRAKVSHEILINPGHAGELQNTCTSCHAPMGHYDAVYNGAQYYTLADLQNDSLGQNGVACAACHTIGPDVGNTFSGVIPYDTTRTVYGPFQSPFTGPMILYEGYTPTYSPHMDESRLCSSCHTLITPTVDLNGNFTGGEFVEQATYHEYLNSTFPANNIKCQTCHMPQLEDPIVIANGFMALPPRYPFNQHTFAGSNFFMLDLIKNNRASLGVDVPEDKFDSSLAATTVMLREKSVNFTLLFDSLAQDSGYFRVRIENKAGHKFPSGYPSRRAVLQFVITDASADTVFRSGIFTPQQRVNGETPSFEPHHQVIKADNISQIYELTMGDVNFNFTSMLQRAAHILKDNRIPPLGFTTSANVYDTVRISPDALADPDFNKTGMSEGSGTDFTHFHVLLAGVNGTITVKARLYFQVIPPKWIDEMSTASTAEIDTFLSMYNAADKTPFLIASDSLQVNGVGMGEWMSNLTTPVTVVPSVTGDGRIRVIPSSSTLLLEIELFGADGKKIMAMQPPDRNKPVMLQLPAVQGVYFVVVRTGEGKFLHKVIRQ